MILLDTHTFLWWLSGMEHIPILARKKIEEAKKRKEIYVSAITFWEIAMLYVKERIKLNCHPETWFQKTTTLPFVRIIPIDHNIYWRSVFLSPPFHRDPADRIIVATALSLGAPLVTKDEKILSYSHVNAFWDKA